MLIITILSDLTRSRADLIAENAMLRQQLIVLNRQVKRPQLTNPERFRLVFEVLEKSPSYRSTGHFVALASRTVWHVLAEEIAGQAKDFS